MSPYNICGACKVAILYACTVYDGIAGKVTEVPGKR